METYEAKFLQVRSQLQDLVNAAKPMNTALFPELAKAVQLAEGTLTQTRQAALPQFKAQLKAATGQPAQSVIKRHIGPLGRSAYRTDIIEDGSTRWVRLFGHFYWRAATKG